ncbi:MAG: TetR/AcrR family transcriptional regulator C-terminal domain-containing protein [Ruminococcus sp.]|nr:TetR/AcrR family transcriptional regulator C-terminal domain-containing protein [Ruminococcus sp.]
MKRKTTKEILAESFQELAANKRIDKITITEITSNCGMSQPTFYNHFKDKYDLIVWIYIHESGEIMSKIGRDGYSWRNTLIDGAHYFAEKREYFLNALRHTSGQDSFLRYLQKVNSELMLTEVRKKLMTEYIPDEIYGMIKVYVYGTVHHMLEWLTNDRNLSPEKVAEIWEHSLPEPLKQYLYD